MKVYGCQSVNYYYTFFFFSLPESILLDCYIKAELTSRRHCYSSAVSWAAESREEKQKDGAPAADVDLTL